jgi:hypothetical protein
MLLAGQFLSVANLEKIRELSARLEGAPDASGLPQLVWQLLAARFVDHDPREALEFAARIGERKLALLREQVFVLWVEKDIAAAVATLDDEDAALIAKAGGAAAKRDMSIALGLIDRFPANRDLAGAVLERLAETDPHTAIARARSLPRTDWLLQKILAVWMKSSPNAALAFLDELPDDRPKAAMVKDKALRSLIESDPDRAAHYIFSTRPKSKARYDLVVSLAGAMARRDPEQTIEWARSIDPGPEQHAAVAAAIKAISERGSHQLFSLLDEIGWRFALSNTADGHRILYGNGSSSGFHDSVGLNSATQSALLRLAKENPRAAMQRVAQLPAHAGRRLSAATPVAVEWFRNDPEAFLEWMNTDMPESAASTFAGSIVQDGERRRRTGSALVHRPAGNRQGHYFASDG